MGLPDPRSQGSLNPGATNVYEFAGKKAGAFTLLGDALKGFIPVLVAVYLEVGESVLIFVALFAFLGHLYPLFFKFQGGKGVATAFGIFVALNYLVALAVLLTWLLIVKLFKLSSLGALITALLSPLYFYLLDGSTLLTLLSTLISSLLIYKHRSNISHILDGTET